MRERHDHRGGGPAALSAAGRPPSGKGTPLRTKQGIVTAALLAAFLAPAPAARAVETSFWRLNDATEFLAGEEVDGVVIESDGYLTLGPAMDSVVTRLEGVSYIWCLARDSKGRVWFGTGDNGGIYRWSKGEKAKLVWRTGAGEITSIVVDAKDNVYAGSAPGGTIFRVSASGDTSRYFESGEESIWSLLVGKDGAVYAGTGSQGKVFRVTGAGKGSVLAETKDVNVLALAWAKDGALLAGTASKGLLIRIDSTGETRVLYDADSEELRAIGVFPDGAVAVGTSRGQPGRPSAGAAEVAPRGGAGRRPGAGESPFAIEVTPTGGGKSGVFLVQTDGSARLLYAPPTEFIYAIAPADSHTAWVATGDPGVIFRVGRNKKFALLAAPEQPQILALLKSGNETYAATGNPAVLYSLAPGMAREGTYISDPHDLRSVASWGRISAEVRGGDVTIASRSGLGETPDEGWSDWSSESPLRNDTPISSPAARFLQFRLTLKRSGDSSPTVSAVEIAYRQRNLPPEIGNIEMFGPEVPFFEGGPEYRPPQISQSYPNGLKVEYTYPRSGPRAVSDASAAWARGIRTVTWEALDPNGDDLLYNVSIKAEDEREWRSLAAERKDRVLSWDAESFPNDAYRIKVEATDRPDNPPDASLSTERVSPVFQIDNVQPRIENLKADLLPGGRGGRGGVVVSGTAIDADSRISVIEYSTDGSDWARVFPSDGLFDQRTEAFRFEIRDLTPGEHRITVRASDQDRNVAVAKILSIVR